MWQVGGLERRQQARHRPQHDNFRDFNQVAYFKRTDRDSLLDPTKAGGRELAEVQGQLV